MANGETMKSESDGQAVADAMEQLERAARAPVGFVPASDTGLKGSETARPVETANPEAIDLDEMDE